MVRRRALKPDTLEEVLRLAVPGQGRDVDSPASRRSEPGGQVVDQSTADPHAASLGLHVAGIDDAERGFTDGVDPTDGQAHHSVVDRADENPTTGVGHQPVESSGAHQGLGQQTRLPPGEQGAPPHVLDGVEGPAAQFAAAVSVAAHRQTGCFHHR